MAHDTEEEDRTMAAGNAGRAQRAACALDAWRDAGGFELDESNARDLIADVFHLLALDDASDEGLSGPAMAERERDWAWRNFESELRDEHQPDYSDGYCAECGCSGVDESVTGPDGRSVCDECRDEAERVRPDDEDGFIHETSRGYLVVLGARCVGERWDVQDAAALLAAQMEDDNYSPNAWLVNERGNVEQLRLSPFAADTGEYELVGNGYV